MVRFLLQKGHDGPARKGKLQFESEGIDTPLVTGPSKSLYSMISYSSFDKIEEESEGFHLLSTGSILSKKSIDPLKNTLFLLPHLIGTTSLPSESAQSLILGQLKWLTDSGLDPTDAIVRIPSHLSVTDLPVMIEKINAAGISTVAFTFNGRFGNPDLQNLILRGSLPRNWLCIAVGRIIPSLIPVIYYTGFDIIDSGFAFAAATSFERLWDLEIESFQKGKVNRFCSCKHCRELSVRESDSSKIVETLELHNSSLFKQMLSASAQLASQGKLRWFVESMSHSSPGIASFIRKLDTSIYRFLEEFTPNHMDTPIALIGPESYNSPIVRRFRYLVEERYTPNPLKKIVLLLPCSARKPYSDSKSHRRFGRIIDRVARNKRDAIAETIITSPLGVVPRELERIYPAGYYDIPVTGDWDAEETTIGANALLAHLRKFPEDTTVIAHVSGGYLDVVKEAEHSIDQSIIYTTSETSATKKVSLELLGETLADMMNLYDLSSKRTGLEDTVRSTADYMFGQGAGNLLVPDDAKVGGKVYGSIITRVDSVQTCLYAGANGRISLTLEGGKRLSSLNRYWVRFEGKTIEGSSLFAIGIDSADPSIRPGDEVIILNNDDDVIGVGRSEMSGKEMCDFRNGLAVKVRHKER